MAGLANTKETTTQATSPAPEGILKVATTGTAFGRPMQAEDLVLLNSSNPVLYVITTEALSTDTLLTATTQAVSLDIAGVANTPVLLENNFPAADNEGRWGLSDNGTAKDGFYLAVSGTWVKKFDDSGDRSLLPNFSGGLTYLGTNLFASAGTPRWTANDLVTDLSASEVAAFDGNKALGSYAYISGVGDVGDNILWKEMDVKPNTAGRFVVDLNDDSTTRNIGTFEIIGIIGSTVYNIPPLSVSSTGPDTAVISGTSIARLGGGNFNTHMVITVDTANTTAYDNYGLRVITASGSAIVITEFECFEIVDNTDLVDCVSMAVLQFAGYQKSETITATPASALDETNGYTEADATAGNITIDLPAPDSALPGKIYTVKKTDVSANTVTVDANTTGGVTIDGANTYVLTAQYDTVVVIDNGVTYDVISKSMIGVAPTAHAASHTNGGDDIQDATAGQKGLATAAQITKLDGIETAADVTDTANVTSAGALMDSELTDLAGVKGVTISTLQVKPTEGAFADGDKTKLDGIETAADVTDATNVDAAGATMNADSTLVGNSYFLDDDTMAGNDDTKVASQQSIKAYVDSKVVSSVEYQGGYNASTNTPDLDTSPSGITKGDMYTVTVAGTFFATALEVGDVLIAEIDNPTVETDWTVVNKDLDAASIKTSYESNADTNEFSDAEQTKLAGIETAADVTDTTNVTAAGALMDSEVTDLAGVKGVTISTLQVKPTEGAFVDGDKTKLDGIETAADVTDTTNVTAAGALMDSEVTDLAGVKGVTISTLQVKPTEGAFVDGDKTKLDGIETAADVTDEANVTTALPVVDETALVYKTGDATANMRIDADNISTGQTRVLTMPDADVVLGVEQFVTAPTTSTDPGVKGQVAFSGSYVYFCVATDTWVRYAVETSF